MKTILACVLLFVTLATPGFTQDQNEPSSPARGQALARRWCAACHLVQLRLTTIDPPTFTAIANDPSKTPDYLRTFFVSPHKDMPPILLTPYQIEDVIAYLGTLKRQ